MEVSSFFNSFSSAWGGEGQEQQYYIWRNKEALIQYITCWRMHNMELYASAQRSQKLLVWKESAARLPSYVVQIPL